MVMQPRLACRLALTAAVTFTGLALSAQAFAGCGDDLLPRDSGGKGEMRAPTPKDLAELRYFGNSPELPGQSPLALSPDGKELSLVLTRGDASNGITCRGVVVVRLVDGVARLIDTGGEDMLITGSMRGYLNAAGEPSVVRPVWSPDGQWVAYLRRDRGIAQAWRAKADGSYAAPVTQLEADAEEIAWSRDGRRLIVSWRPKEAAEEHAIGQEADRGWLYDARVVANFSARPMVHADLPREVISVDADDGQKRLARADEIAALQMQTSADNSDTPEAVAPDGARAWAEIVGSGLLAPTALQLRDARGSAIACTWESCRGPFIGIWWLGGSKTLIFLRREGWNRGNYALYRWTPGSEQPHRILLTQGVINGCLMASGGLICAAEEAQVPKHIVRIDLKSGRLTTIFIPNPEWQHLVLGSVQRLTWTNAYGLPTWGDLVLPPDYKPGTRLPLVITQYFSKGFLRGGTGNEYPIFPLAAIGFAVLSLDRPSVYSSTLQHIETADQLNAANQKDWMERKSLLSALKIGVDKVVAMGIGDPARIGITGLSDGATTVRFALINQPGFAAAAISSCCVEPRTAMTTGGIAWADWQHNALGYPWATDERPDFWRPVALSLNAEHIDTPLLMQLADKEFQLSLEAFTALREHGKPVEMYVFPHEYHDKVNPAHRLNAYIRNIDWFKFWLMGKEDAAPEKAEQYRRWEKMRATQPPLPIWGDISPTSAPMSPRRPAP